MIPSLFHQEPLRKRILLALNIDLIVQHLLRFVGEQNLEHIEPVFDEERPIGLRRDDLATVSAREAPAKETRR